MSEQTSYEDEVEYNGVDTDCLYFLELPIGNVIKIGVTTVGRLFNRIDEAQRFFADDVKYIGIEYCYSREDAHRKERNLKHQFGTARPRSDLIPDSEEVRKYIDENCTDASIDLEISREDARETNRSRAL